MAHPLLRSALFATVLSTSLALPASAQRADHLVRSDFEFAKGLATRFRYVELAEEVIVDLEKSSIDKDLRSELDLVKCEVYGEGAKFERDPIRRRELFDKAIASYETYMAENPFSDLLDDAERSYVDLTKNYGVYLERELDDAVGEEVTAIRSRITEVLEGSLKLTGEQIDLLEKADEPSMAQKNEKYRLMLNRGQILLTLARASEEGTFYYSKAEETFENLALEGGELSFVGLNAYIFLGKTKIAQNEFLEATDYLSFVADVAIPSDRELKSEVWDPLSAAQKARQFLLAEVAVEPLIDAAIAAGDTQTALKWSLHFYNTWKSGGFSISPSGYLSLLSAARALLDTGGVVGGSVTQGTLKWYETEEDARSDGHTSRAARRTALDLALSIAQSVNDENKGNTLQIRAQKLISDVISRPGVAVSPDILLQAAEGEYYNENYGDAIDALKRVLAELESQDDSTRLEYGGRVMFFLGRSLARLGRDLEAAVTHREGVTTWEGDPEYDEKNAKGYYDAVLALQRTAPEETAFRDMKLEAEQLRIAKQSEGDTGDIIFRQGERLYDDGDFAGARAKFVDVPPGTNSHEEAKVKAALCLYKMSDTDGATKEWLAYLNDFITDPTNALTSERRIATRQKARALATFYLGRIAYAKQDWAEAIQWLTGFDTKFPNQDSYGPNALYMLQDAHLSQKDVEAAKAVQERMMDKYATHSRTGVAAYDIYKYLKAEQEKAEAAGNAEAAKSLKRQMAEYMGIYNGLSAPSLTNLRVEAALWVDLGAWDRVEQVLANALAAFESDPAEAKVIETAVKPLLGEALLAQKRIPDAFAVLDPLMPDLEDDTDTRKPSAEVAHNWCRSVSGWVEGDARNVVEVPGVGGVDRLREASEVYQKLVARAENYTCEWYQLKFDRAYNFYRWGQDDSQQTLLAKEKIEELKIITQSNDLAIIAEPCGDDVLQQRFLWLLTKVR